MAFSDTFDTTNPGSAVSNREDLMDVLTILAPEETPVLSSASKSRANSTFVEWTVDSLSSPSTTGIAEGADVTTFTDQFSGRARLGNYVQKFRRDYMVSDLQEAVDSVGPAKVAQAEAKAIRELTLKPLSALPTTALRKMELERFTSCVDLVTGLIPQGRLTFLLRSALLLKASIQLVLLLKQYSTTSSPRSSVLPE
jgi:hypothetical protein